jgi:transcription termination factor NusB
MPVLNILRISLYQIIFLDRIPNYACCNEAINIIKLIFVENVESLSKFVNGVLRAFLRDKQHNKNFIPQTDDNIFNLAIIHSHPE